MQLSCKQQSLANALSIVCRAINNNNTLPVLNNILLETKDNQIQLCATNLEIAIKTIIPAEITEAGSITIPAKVFTSYVQLINQKNVDLKLTRDLSVEISNQEDYTKIKSISATDFPSVPTIQAETEVVITEKELAQGLHLTAFSASLHSSRPALAGVLFKITDGVLTLAATDSYRLAEKKIKLVSSEKDFSCVLPVRSAHELAKLLQADSKNELTIKLSKNQMEIVIGNTTFISRLIEADYPDYSKIIPQTEKTKIIVEKAEIDTALKKISIFTREINNNMKIAIIEDQLRLLSNETKIGEGEVKIKVKKEGENNEVAVNSQFLHDVINILNEKELTLIINDNNLPILVKSEKTSDYLYFIMPLKI